MATAEYGQRFQFIIHFLFSCLITSLQSKATSAQCYHYLSGSEGVLFTPNYPENYPEGLACVWTITVSAEHYVELTFDDFDIEPYDDCKTDVLEIKDGGTKQSPLIGGQYCNYRRPPKVVTSSDNQLRLWFSSDSTIQHRGFKATYRAVRDEVCGGDLTSPHGEISTPRFPLHYPRNRKCIWKIHASKGKYIVLNFLHFEIETACPLGKKCICLDKVEIKDGEASKTYCFSAPPTIISSGNELTISFFSDIYGRLEGFKALYTQSSTDKCGSDIYASNGTITSPLFDPTSLLRYPHYTDCIWRITTEKEMFISLRVLFMDIPSSVKEDCSEDYLEIRDGDDKDSTLFGYYCNKFIPDVLISSGNVMYIRFHSNDNVNGKGFQLSYSTHTNSCTSSLGMEDGRITKFNLMSSSLFAIAHTPERLEVNYGRLNGPYAWCSQERRNGIEGEYFEINFNEPTKITKIATQGYTMNGNSYYITSYKLQYAIGEIILDYINRNDDAAGTQATIFTGNTDSNTTKSNTLEPPLIVRKLILIPLTFQSGPRKHLCLRMEVYGCPITGNREVLTLSRATKSATIYKQQTHSWVITADVSPSNSVYIFRVNKLTADCTTTRLSLAFDGNSYLTNQTFCNEVEVPPIIFSFARQLWIDFTVDSTPITLQQVEFQYEVQQLYYGRVVTEEHGIVEGPSQVLSRDNKPSIWLFTFQPRSKISVQFTRIHLAAGTSIVVKNGLFQSSRVIHTLTGTRQPLAFMVLHETMRVEYFTELTPYKYTHEGFTLRYSVLNEGVQKIKNWRWIKG